jgi:anti-sigma-K factor RskA
MSGITSDDRYLELAPLAALGALDGPERSGFEAHVADCPACRGELQAHEAVAGRIALSLAPVPPSSVVRRRVLEATGSRATVRPPRSAAWPWTALATAAALVLAVALFVVKGQRDEARRQASWLASRIHDTESELASLRQNLGEEQGLHALVAHPDSRMAPLSGLKDAPQARARVIWNAASRRAVLLVSGLPPAPQGKAYEVWVIAGSAPTPAGVFRVDAHGTATFTLLIVEDTAQVKTFAVTLEPAEGVPAPTGPMMLAGTVS